MSRYDLIVEVRKPQIVEIHEICKFNPYHDEKGRFSSKPGGGGQTEGEYKLYDREAFKEIADNETVKAIVDEYSLDYAEFGIRIQEDDTETLGERMTHLSSNFGGDFDDPDMGLEDMAGELNGVCTIGYENVSQVPKFGGYEGKVAYLLGSDKGEYGYDSGERVLEEPTVLAKLGYIDGKLTVIESVKGSTSQKEQEPKNTQTERRLKPGYIEFMNRMASKYGEDKMWSQMSDQEFDEAQRWEANRWEN